MIPRRWPARLTRSPPASTSRACRYTPIPTAAIAATPYPIAAFHPISTAIGMASSAGNAHGHAKPRHRSTTATAAPTTRAATANPPAVRTISAKRTIGTTGTPAAAARPALFDQPLATTRSHLDPPATDTLHRTESLTSIRYSLECHESRGQGAVRPPRLVLIAPGR